MRTNDDRLRAAASTDHDEQHAMRTCTICDLAIEGPRLTDSETGLELHPACVAERVPQDAVIALSPRWHWCSCRRSSCGRADRRSFAATAGLPAVTGADP